MGSELHSLYEKVGEIAGVNKQLLTSISDLNRTMQDLRKDMASIKTVQDMEKRVDVIEGRLTSMERFKFAVLGGAMAGGLGVGGIMHMLSLI